MEHRFDDASNNLNNEIDCRCASEVPGAMLGVDELMCFGGVDVIEGVQVNRLL